MLWTDNIFPRRGFTVWQGRSANSHVNIVGQQQFAKRAWSSWWLSHQLGEKVHASNCLMRHSHPLAQTLTQIKLKPFFTLLAAQGCHGQRTDLGEQSDIYVKSKTVRSAASSESDLPQSPSKVQTGRMFPNPPKLLQKHAKNYPREWSQGHFGGWGICCNVGTKHCQHSSAAGWKPRGYSKCLTSKSRDLKSLHIQKQTIWTFHTRVRIRDLHAFTNGASVLQRKN